jgi:cell division topological specificity factor
MFSFLKRDNSRDKVKKRLQLMLAYDRAEFAPGKMDALQEELIEVIRKYFPQDGDGSDFDVTLERHEDHLVFIANVPVQ